MIQSKKASFSLRSYSLFWLGVIAAACGFIWLLGDILTPFVTGLVVAYLLNPLVTRASNSMPRSMATLLILITFVWLVIGAFAILSPLVAKQLMGFFEDLPVHAQNLQKWLNPYFERVMDRLSPGDVQKIRDAASENVGAVLGSTQNIARRILTGGLAVIDIITFLAITPIVAFYCMRDWPVIVRRADDLLPRRHADVIREMFAEFDQRLAGFLRGQLLVCLCLGTFYASALSLTGLNFALAIGLIAGLLSFIPYVGSVTGFVSSVGVAIAQYGNVEMPLIVAGIFFAGQFIEGNFLTPKLVGDRIGLHAVWVIFALMAGGNLMGFTGLLLAVPVAAIIGVVVRHGLIWYQNSPAYTS